MDKVVRGARDGERKMDWLYTPKSCYFSEVFPVEVSELVALSGKSQQGIRTQPHLPIHAGGKVDTKEWELGIRNLGIGECGGEAGMWMRKVKEGESQSEKGRQRDKQTDRMTEREKDR